MGTLIKCIKEDNCSKGKLTKDKMYECISKSNLDDFKIASDDRGNEEWYRQDYFEISKVEFRKLQHEEIDL